jgi:hypothetical protein
MREMSMLKIVLMCMHGPMCCFFSCEYDRKIVILSWCCNYIPTCTCSIHDMNSQGEICVLILKRGVHLHLRDMRVHVLQSIDLEGGTKLAT